MAKRRAARTARSKASPRKAPRAGKTSKASKGKTGKGKTAQARSRKAVRKPARRPAARKVAARKAAKAKRAVPRKAPKTVKAAHPAASTRPKKAQPATRLAKPPAKVAKVTATVKAKVKAKASVPARSLRRSPAVERERRAWTDAVVPGPPSALDLDRSASAARSGRRELLERHKEHHESGPSIAGGDIDANWESAYSVGDEAPGGDSPTPDQDLVDDIGEAVGLVYEDDEELKGDEKVVERDRHRWEFDPASSDDFEDR